MSTGISSHSLSSRKVARLAEAFLGKKIIPVHKITKLSPSGETKYHLEAALREHSTIDSCNLLNVFKVVSFGVDICCISWEG